MIPITDEQIVRALIVQVASAVPPGGNERDVTTVISRPMWNAFCRATGIPEDSEPTRWVGANETRRVYGSATVVVENGEMISVSFCGVQFDLEDPPCAR